MKKMFLLLMASMILIAGLAVYGDTSFVTGDGQRVVYGRSVMTMNYQDSSGTQKKECLLVGSIRGMAVVALTKPGEEEQDNLYMVEVIDSRNCRYNGLAQNVITFKNEKIARWMWVSGGVVPCLRAIEIVGEKDTDDSNLIVCYGKEEYCIFKLESERDLETTVTTLKASGCKTINTQERICNLDIIDINDYLANKKDVKDGRINVQPAVVLWVQHKDYKSKLPSKATVQPNTIQFSTFKDDKLNVYQEQLLGWCEAPDCYHLAYQETYYNSFASGGAFVNPDQDGNICYWFGWTLMKLGRYWVPPWNTRIAIHFHMQTHSLPMYVETGSRRLMFKNSVKQNELFFEYGSGEWDHAQGRVDQFTINWTGPMVRQVKDKEIDRIHIDQWIGGYEEWVDREIVKWEHDSGHVGTLETLFKKGEQTFPIKPITKYDGMTEEKLTAMQKAERAMLSNGVTVNMVIYGWPYFGKPTAPSQFNTPSFNKKQSIEKVTTKRTSNGVGFSEEIGGVTNLLTHKTTLTVIGGLEYAKGEEHTEASTAAKEIEGNYNDSDFDRFCKRGYVIYDKIKPMIFDWGRFKPAKTDKIKIEGVNPPENYKFEFPALGVGYENGFETGYKIFNITNPDYLLDNDVSPLSAGLLKRDITVITDTGIAKYNADLAKIDNWENKKISGNDLREIPDLLEINDSGITPAIATINDKEAFKMHYPLHESISLSYSHKKIDSESDSLSWYTGKHWSVEPQKGTGVYHDLTIKYNGSKQTIDTGMQGNAYSIILKGSDKFSQSIYFYTYLVNIDINKLQAYLYKQNPKRGKPSYIPDYCWNNHQNFTLIFTLYDENAPCLPKQK